MADPLPPDAATQLQEALLKNEPGFNGSTIHELLDLVRSWLPQDAPEYRVGERVRIGGCVGTVEHHPPRVRVRLDGAPFSGEFLAKFVHPAALPAAQQPVSATETADLPQTADDISTSVLAALDTLREDFHARIVRLAQLDYPPASPEAKVTRSLIKLMADLGEARWSFVSGTSTPTTTAVPMAVFAEPQKEA